MNQENPHEGGAPPPQPVKTTETVKEPARPAPPVPQKETTKVTEPAAIPKPQE